jgi:hypothetical protein
MPKEFWVAVIAVVVVPLLVLVMDYMYRPAGGILDTLSRTGSDLCLVGLGASGPMSVDPKVLTEGPLPVAQLMVVMILMIVIFRGLCLKLALKATTFRAIASCTLGLASITTIFAILYLSYRR